MSKHFSDVGKDSKDLLNDDFPSDGTVKFTTQSKTPDGVTAKATLRRFTKAGREQIEAVIEPKYEFKEKNIEISGKFATSNDFSANVIVKDLVKGSKIEVSGTSNEKTATSKIVVSHNTEPVAAKISLTIPLDLSPTKKTATKLNGDVVIQYPENLYVGGNVFLDLNEKMGAKCEGVVSYSQNHWEITGRGNFSPPSGKESSVVLWGVSFFHKVSDNIKWALDFETDQALKRGPVGVVAGEYKLDNYTTLKGKCSIKMPDPKSKPDVRVALSAKQKVNSFLSLSLGADLNVRNILSGDAEGLHTFGVEVKLQE